MRKTIKGAVGKICSSPKKVEIMQIPAFTIRLAISNPVLKNVFVDKILRTLILDIAKESKDCFHKQHRLAYVYLLREVPLVV